MFVNEQRRSRRRWRTEMWMCWRTRSPRSRRTSARRHASGWGSSPSSTASAAGRRGARRRARTGSRGDARWARLRRALEAARGELEAPAAGGPVVRDRFGAAVGDGTASAEASGADGEGGDSAEAPLQSFGAEREGLGARNADALVMIADSLIATH